MVAVLADFEDLIDKYKLDFEEEPIMPEQKRDALKMILPREIEKAFNLNMLGRDDDKYVEYDDLKEAAEEFIAEWDSYKVAPKRTAGVAATDDVDTVSKGKGKGDDKGGGGAGQYPGKGAQQPPGSCRRCWKFGHFARDCPVSYTHLTLPTNREV